jgi:hypothetical protein
MSFFVDQPELLKATDVEGPDDSFQAFLLLLRKNHEAYRAYLEAIKHQIPSAVYDFATADWHYDHRDPKCPHDAWVKELRIKEAESDETRHTQIEVDLVAALGFRSLKLTYLDVSSYKLGSPEVRHGDWLTDEIHLSKAGRVVHEIEFASGARWTIECRDIRFEEVLEPSPEEVKKD